MRPADAFPHASTARRPVGASSLRAFSVRHAAGLAAFYLGFERALVALRPVFAALGWARVERPVAVAEKFVKTTLFDCRMCGQCVLSSTGMSCPMNCPKALRNGPCGGVRADGACEVQPTMRCVWVAAHEGAALMGDALATINAPLDHRRAGASSWLSVARDASS